MIEKTSNACIASINNKNNPVQGRELDVRIILFVFENSREWKLGNGGLFSFTNQKKDTATRMHISIFTMFARMCVGGNCTARHVTPAK